LMGKNGGTYVEAYGEKWRLGGTVGGTKR
jgi:hypothetical protein